MTDRIIHHTPLTGVKMSAFNRVKDDIEVGVPLSIHRRPDNSYDPQAMSVHFGAFVSDPQVGWIPAKEFEDRIVKAILFRLAEHVPLEGIVTAVDREKKELSINVCIHQHVVITDTENADADGLDREDDEDEDD